MHAHRIGFHLLVLFFATTCEMSFAQDRLRGQLFDETDRVMAQAREKKADLYSPTNFGKALEFYKDAEDDFKRGRNLDDIRGKLKGANSYFAKAIDACKVAEVTFSSTMAARTDALSADAPKFSVEIWKKGEEQFKSAAQELEGGDINDARKEAGGAETFYRTAELEAIKANYLSPARQLLRRADDMDVKDNAPRTLDKAKKLSTQVETLLKQNRYDTDEARQLAQEAKYEASHAIYLHQAIAKLKKDDKDFEEVMLMAEEPVKRIAASVDAPVEFDAGFEGPSKEVINAINQLKNKAAQDGQTIKSQESEIANLRQQVASMEGRLGSLSETEKDLQRKLGRQKEQEESIAQVNRLFSAGEGNVVRDGNNIVIRLWGLTFPVGRNTIEPQYFPLLTKVQDAIRKFPGCQVAIEGHTDSQGSDETNQRLSEARAEAVSEYLKANMVAGFPITWAGYGESRPVASNDTFAGRAKNRRIDVVIVPEWVIVGK